MVEQFANGVFFVSLAPIRDWELVVPTIAQTLGLREQSGESVVETLTEYVRDKQVLLVLDNFEQVVAAAPVLAGLLGSAPGLNVLVTSRTPLHLSGERTYAVRPLALGRVDASSSVERAPCRGGRVRPHRRERRRPSPRSACGSTACRSRSSSPHPAYARSPRRALRRRLDERLKLLTGGAQDLDERQRTLRGTIEWSYELL